MSRTLAKLAAVAKRDLLTTLRHRGAFLVDIIGLTAELAGFYFLARAIGPNYRPDGMGYFPFVLIGSAVYSFMVLGVGAFVTAVQEAQQTGVMEVLCTTATPAPTVLLMSGLSAFGQQAVRGLLYLLLGISLFRVGTQANIAAAAVVLIFCFVIGMGIGMVGAAIQVALQKGSAVVWLFGTLAWLVSGMAFPVSALPPFLRPLAELMPLTHCIRGMRLALMGATSAELLRSISVLIVFSLVVLPTGLLLLAASIRRARLEGSLSFY